MLRDCCVCNLKVTEVELKTWMLPSMPDLEIGFGICDACGMVIQSTSPSEVLIKDYYENTATYINPGNKGKPKKEKIDSLERYFSIIETVINFPKSVFQVGCSDGYTLDRFKKRGSQIVSGVDPSIASNQLAKKLYGIDTIVGTIENISLDGQKFDLVLLTHVLEHLFNPIHALEICKNFIKLNGLLFIEVPLFENYKKQPNGVLSLEHLNYFSESTLVETITRAGYEVIKISKDFNTLLYPVIAVCCKPKDGTNFIPSKDASKNKNTLKRYLDFEKKIWASIYKNIQSNIGEGSEIYIYGGGIHTSQLLANTPLKEYASILNIVDSSPTKWGKSFGRYTCIRPEEISDSANAIVISSKVSEEEIFNFLQSHPCSENLKIIKLYS